jgi:hypothetical protein
MIKHVVMFKFKDKAEGADRSENAGKLRALLEGLVGKIPEIKLFEVGITFNNSEAAYDLVLISEFDDVEALQRYQKHPEHMLVFDFVQRVCQSRVVGDYII